MSGSDLMDPDEPRFIRYLVGDLPDAEQAELERQYFDDPAVVDRLSQTESRLLDDYARGQLPEDLRERVARRYLAHPVRRERLKFAEALAASLDDVEFAPLQLEPTPPPWHRAWSGGAGRGAQGVAALAVVVLSVTAGWLYVERTRLKDTVSRAQAALATQEQRERELAQQLTAERVRADSLVAERDRLLAQQANPPAAAGATRSSPAVVSLLIAVGGSRAPDDIQRTLKIPPGTE